MDLEVYEIDYRGPQTHSSIPPPVNWRGKPLSHRKTAVEPSKSKGLGVGHIGGTVSPRDDACHDRCLVIVKVDEFRKWGLISMRSHSINLAFQFISQLLWSLFVNCRSRNFMDKKCWKVVGLVFIKKQLSFPCTDNLL